MKDSAALQAIRSLRSVWPHLSAATHREIVVLLVLMLITAFTEVLSLGAVLPFIAVLAAPERVLAHPLGSQVVRSLGSPGTQEVALLLTLAFIGAALLAGLMRLITVRMNAHVAMKLGSEVSVAIYRRTLYQPYSVHVSRNSSEVISGITNKVDALVYGVVQSTLTLLSAAVVTVAVLGALLTLSAQVAIASAAAFGVSYAVIAFVTRSAIGRASREVAQQHVEIVRALQEGLGGIRDVLLDGTQPVYCEIYQRADGRFRAAQARITFASISPRYAMEAAGMVFIAALAFVLSGAPGGLGTALPLLAALALGAQRLLPALQQMYGAWVSIAASQASVLETVEVLSRPLPPDALGPPPEPLQFTRQIELAGVWFRYGEGAWVLSDVNVVVPKGARVGIVGRTGGGKSTMLDVLMGLLPPTRGEVRLDGASVAGGQMRSWQRAIAHVPQAIYLSDASIAENIAFGVPRAEIDLERVHAVAQRAQLALFVETLPKRYDTHVGERGVRLSGGQRQRIGIARALYKRANVLVLDEATSALDNETEESVMQSIDGLGPEYTAFLVAHRLTTLRGCDFIIAMDGGRVAGCGSYDDLIARRGPFAATVPLAADAVPAK